MVPQPILRLSVGNYPAIHLSRLLPVVGTLQTYPNAMPVPCAGWVLQSFDLSTVTFEPHSAETPSMTFFTQLLDEYRIHGTSILRRNDYFFVSSEVWCGDHRRIVKGERVEAAAKAEATR